ncbi:hypothetical protein [Mycobacterium sp. AT1]|uniref:hypothetical protein n=1 Tax=Mycobacterium sp. AT1 TaxID=1961706 RepID=UPI0009ABB41D|nr:hypothetical protein [Mycobacterium sp. AT1]OPX12843.1 hypothetical protein B1790_02900 [Mycobacterium sp. AT1]
MTETPEAAIERDGDDQNDPSTTRPLVKWSEAWWATRPPEVQARRCKARHSDGSGERCCKAAMKGQRVCGSHGGKAKKSIEAAKRRIAESADPAAAQLVKLAFDKRETAEIRLRATLQLLDRAGLNARTAIDIEVSQTPSEQILEGLSTQLEVTSRAAFRASSGVEDDQSDVSTALANLAARDRAEAHANADRHRDLAERLRAQHSRDDDGIVDAIVVDVRESAQPFTPADYEHSPDAYGSPVPLSPTRPGGPMDQAVTVEQGNELMAELRARQAQRAHDERRSDGRAVIHPARRALPPGRSQK